MDLLKECERKHKDNYCFIPLSVHWLWKYDSIVTSRVVIPYNMFSRYCFCSKMCKDLSKTIVSSVTPRNFGFRDIFYPAHFPNYTTSQTSRFVKLIKLIPSTNSLRMQRWTWFASREWQNSHSINYSFVEIQLMMFPVYNCIISLVGIQYQFIWPLSGVGIDSGPNSCD